MLPKPLTINIKKFLSVATQLALEASRIIKDVYESKDLGKIMKGVNDPVTEADFRVQTMIMDGLRSYWPTLRMIGEETSNFKGQFVYDYQQYGKSFLDDIEGFDLEKSQELNLEDSCVWIDPLDGTLSYTKGDLDEVTTLIGLSYKKKARLGVMGIPYTRKEKDYLFKPKVLIGDAERLGVLEIDQNLFVNKLEAKKPGKDFSVVITKNNVSPAQFHFVQSISKNILQIGGCGKKISMVVYGEADSMVYLGNRVCMWDICAGHALVKAAGGQFTTSDGRQILYDPEAKSYLSKGGISCAITSDVQKVVLGSTSGYFKQKM